MWNQRNACLLGLLVLVGVILKDIHNGVEAKYHLPNWIKIQWRNPETGNRCALSVTFGGASNCLARYSSPTLTADIGLTKSQAMNLFTSSLRTASFRSHSKDYLIEIGYPSKVIASTTNDWELNREINLLVHRCLNQRRNGGHLTRRK